MVTSNKWRTPLLIALFAGMTGPMAEGAAPSVSAVDKSQFARILFKSSERVPFRASMDGRVLTVRFEEEGPSGLGAVTGSLGAYVESARMVDGKTARITLKAPYPVRTFVSRGASGIDLLQVRSSKYAAGAKAAKTEVAETIPAKATAEKPVKKAGKTAKNKLVRPDEKKAERAIAKGEKKLPEAKTPAPVAAPVAEVATREEKIQPPEPVTEKTPPEPARVEAPAAAEKAKPTDAVKTVAVKTVAVPSMSGGRMAVGVETRRASTILHFPWKERTAAAAFASDGSTWFVFDRPATVDLAALRSVLPPALQSVEQWPDESRTIIRIAGSGIPLPVMATSPGSYEWTANFGRRALPPEKPITPQARIEPPLKPSIFLDVLETSAPVNLTMANGRTLQVVPLYEAGRGVFPGRKFVDVTLPRTSEGVVIDAKNDQLKVLMLRNGIRLSAPAGVTVSANLPQPDVAALVAEERGSGTFLPYDEWKAKEGFVTAEETLRIAIGEAPDPEVSILRRKLAELYLSEGMAFEAIGVLNLLYQSDPRFYTDQQLAAERGAANFLAGRIDEAANDFASPSLEGEEEIEYWKRLVEVLRGRETKPLRFFDWHPRYEHLYPPEIRRKIALIAADQALGQADYSQAIAVMKTLAEAGIIEPVREYQQFIVGRILAETGEPKKAEQILQKLFDTTNDRFIRARAGYTLATTRYKAGETNRKDTIAALDRLRVIWRGDQLEMNLLKLIGELNVNEGNYLEGLRAWKELLQAYPALPDATALTARMSEVFGKLFNDGDADRMSPLEALSTFYEFKDLTPIGPDGDRMIQKLSDRLAAVDLLDRAAALLEHQIAYRLERGERSRVGARLALIYLLNKQPGEAIKVLELTGYGNNDEALSLQRRHLAANAYAATGDFDTARGMLKNDFAPEGKQIKLDIAWQAKDWAQVATIAEDMLASRKDITAPLDATESQTLMRLAIAYTFQDDTQQLAYLRDYFSPLMANNPDKAAFDFITSDSGPVQPENLSKLAEQMSRTKGFLDSYRQSVAGGGLSKAVP